MIYRQTIGDAIVEYEGTTEEIKAMLKAECTHTGLYDHAALNTGDGIEYVCLRCKRDRPNKVENIPSEGMQKLVEEFQKNELLRTGKITTCERADIVRSIKEPVCTLNDKDAIEKMLHIKFYMLMKHEYAENQKVLGNAEVHQYGIRGFIDDMPLDTEVYKDGETVWFILKRQGLVDSVYEVPLQPIYPNVEL